ncbi:MAG TPA: SRPBCC family protein [Rhodanobacteraceae bacterium]|nr:SRPBCC family protein [Rhodanobacteraceae bacterium]
MVARKESESQRTTVQKKSEREVVVTRTFDAPARLVFEAWSKPELFKKWWVPRSMGMTLRSCEMDVRTGGKYRLVFGDDPANPMAFFGNYVEVVPDKRIVWTNEESGDAGSVTTVTFEERDGKTLLVMSELYPTKEALDAAGTGAQEATHETFGQLDELLAEMSARLLSSR